MEQNCEVSFDCLANSTVAKQCYEENDFREETFFCDCSSWYGWTGENCDIPTSTVYYSRLVICFFTVWGLFNIITLFKSLYLYLKYVYDVKTPRNFNSIFYVLLFESVASFLLLLVRLLQLPSFFDSTLFVVSSDSEENILGPDVQIKSYSGGTGLFLFLGIIFHGFASTVIVLSWLRVFNTISRMIEPDYELVSEKIMQRLIIGSLLAFYIIFIILLSVEDLRIGSFFLSPIGAIFLIAFNVTGYVKFRNKMNSFLEGNLGYSEKRALMIVKRSCQINVVCLTAVFANFSIAVVGLDVHDRVLKIGSFNYFLIFIDIAFLFGMISISYTSFYVHNVNRNLLKKKGIRGVTWIPFASLCLYSVDEAKTQETLTYLKT